MSNPQTSLPRITDLNRPFWEAAHRGELRLQRCENCHHIRYPIAATCPVCLRDEASWLPLSGRGEVFASVVYHRAFGGPLADHVPYVVAIVQLDEGPRMLSNIVGGGQARVGDPVEVVFETLSPDCSVPRFRLAEAAG